MRTFALIAFFALQLSAFTCGYDIHLHSVDSGMGHMAEHFHQKNQHQQDKVNDNSCHVHASHTFDVYEAQFQTVLSQVSNQETFLQVEWHLKTLSSYIDHPPKLLG